MSHSFTKIAFKCRSIGPWVFSFSMEFSSSILSLIFISINKYLCSKAIFDWLNKCPLIILPFWEFQSSVTILFSIFPFPLVDYFSSFIIEYSLPIFYSLYPLSIVDVSVMRFHDASSMFFAIHELSFINMLIEYYFYSISRLLTFTILLAFPPSHVKLSIVMPKDCIECLGKYDTVLIFFHGKIGVLIINLNIK